jgi:hypothetical protein
MNTSEFASNKRQGIKRLPSEPTMFARQLRAHTFRDMSLREQRDAAAAVARKENIYIDNAKPKVRERMRLRKVHNYAHGSENVAISTLTKDKKELEKLSKQKKPTKFHLSAIARLEARIPKDEERVENAKHETVRTNIALDPKDQSSAH